MAIGTKRWPMIALALSVGLNLFAAGLFAGWGGPAHLEHGPDGRPPRFELTLERMADSLPPDDARIIRRVLSLEGSRIAMAEQRRYELLARVQDILATDPYDPQALAGAINEETAAEANARNQLRNAVLAAAAELSPDARKQVARMLP